jgi:hypothetical protein
MILICFNIISLKIKENLNAIDLNEQPQCIQPGLMKPDHHHKSLIDVALNGLRNVMLYDASLRQQLPPQQSLPQPPQQTQIQPSQQTQIQPQPQDNRFRPALNQDPLFWCLYIMKNGAFKYDQLANRFTAEQDGKRDEIMMLRDKGKSLKQSTGLKFTASTLEGDIMSKCMTLHAFHVLVRLHSLNVVFVNHANHVYAEFISDAVSDKPVYIIERSIQNPKQMVMNPVTETQLTQIKATHHRIENVQKPIKSASAYTVAELTEMCHQLKIQLNAKMKKQEIYDAVVKQLAL